MLALIVGAMMIAAGIAKLGFVADLLSKPTQIGYMNGLALTILVGQLPKLFGFSVSANGLISEANAFLEGIAVAVGLSIFNVFRRAWWPYQTTLGRVPGLAGQHDRRLHPDAEELPGLVIFRFDAPLFFANARTFRDQIRRLASADPRPDWIVIAAEPITDVDTTAADMLADLDQELNAGGTFLVFAELKDPVRTKLERYALIGPLDPDHFFPTLDAAVDAFRQRTGADWAPPTFLASP